MDKVFERIHRLHADTSSIHDEFKIAQTKELKHHLILAVMSSFFYNSQLAFHYLLEKNLFDGTF